MLPGQLDAALLLMLISHLVRCARLHVLSCPSQCHCTPGVFSIHVHCAARNFTSMPDFPKNMYLELLDLADNDVRILPKQSFREPQTVRELYFQRNNLQEIEAGAFAKMTSLRILDLGHNGLKQLPEQLFTNLSSLQVLVLANNRIASIAKELFRATFTLRELDLSGNRLQAVPASSLQGLADLKKLHLSHNLFSGLRAADFASLPSLEQLDLSNVSLSSVSANVFRPLSDLKWLDLSHNHLARVSFVKGLSSSLTTLDLTANPLLCDCGILEYYHWASGPNQSLDSRATSQAVCGNPDLFFGESVFHLRVDDLCPGVNDSVTAPSEHESEAGNGLYDPMLGWYTAATLSAMLLAFLLCVTLDKLKRRWCRYRRRKRRRREKLKYEKSLSKEQQKEVTLCLVPVTSLPSLAAPVARSVPEKQEGVGETAVVARSQAGKASNVARTASIKNKPTLTLTLPEGTRQLELPSCLKKADMADDHSKDRVDSPSRTSFVIHPHCPIHNPTGAKNILRPDEAESSL